MLISFFEEFPTKRNLNKIKLINFKTKLYIAAKSYKEFNKVISKIKNKNILEFIYWPILSIKEGYWISPFADRKALLRIFNEQIDHSIMIDAEIPIHKNLNQIINFYKNKILINKFIKNHNVYTAEYYPKGFLKEKIFSFLGLNFDPKKYNNKVIKMFYHSMHDFKERFIRKHLKYYSNKYKNKFLIAYGVIAKGIGGNEPILSLKQLDKDLSLAKEYNIKEVVIFRLGGLNKKYLNIIKKYVQI